MTRPLRRLPVAALGALLFLSAPAPRALAAGTCCPVVTEPFPSSAANEVIQEFQFQGKMHTAWKVHYAWARGKGLYITGAWFRRGPGLPYMKVADELRLAEIFVAYHPGQPRYYDLTQFNFDLVDVLPADAGCCGELLDRKVVKEIRHTGVTWKDDQNIYRGSALVLWSALDAANYNYIIEYTFHDSGVIELGLGPTARNLPGNESVPHMHLGLWRVDFDINGAANDRVEVVRHVESTGAQTATDVVEPFNGGTEGGVVWNPDEFTTLRVSDNLLVNGRGSRTSWEIMPARLGNARHAEDFSWNDFWVTAYHAGEGTITQVPGYVNGERIDDSDVVLWVTTPAHHLPRDEDGMYVGNVWKGSALVMWARVMFKPRNLFDRTPFFPY
jgi:primary-amine oxidase